MGGFRYILLGGLVIVCAACVGFIFLADSNLKNANNVTELVKESHQVQQAMETVLRSTLEMEAANRGYFMTGDEDVRASYENAKKTLSKNVERCSEFIHKKEVQLERMKELDLLVHRKVALLDSMNRLIEDQEGNKERIANLVVSGDDMMDDLRVLISTMKSYESEQLAKRQTQIDSNTDKSRKVTVLFGVLTIFVALIGYFLILKENVTKSKLFEEKEAAFAEIEKSDSQYRNLINSAEDTICITDETGKILLWNDSGNDMFGLDEAHLLGKKIQNLIHPFHDETNTELTSSRSDDALFKAMDKEVWIGQHKNGPRFRVEISRSKWTADQVQFFAFNIRDISERVKNEEKLQELLAEVSRSNEDLEQFAYVASHDLQEPLRKIRAFGDRLEQVCSEDLSDRGKEYVNRMLDGAARMQKLIQDLLSFSRVSRNTGNLVEVNLSHVLDQVLSDSSISIEETKTVVNFEALPVLKKVNETQMHQLFQNIISNAIKFRKEDQSPQIDITIEEVLGRDLEIDSPALKSEQNYYLIKIADNGIGFDQKYIDKIFTIFQRLHGRNEYAGTGIGLAVCRKICENHSGFLDAQGFLGEGSTFKIVLPTNL